MFNAEMAMFVEGTLLAQGYAVSRAFSLELVPICKVQDFGFRRNNKQSIFGYTENFFTKHCILGHLQAI